MTQQPSVPSTGTANTKAVMHGPACDDQETKRCLCGWSTANESRDTQGEAGEVGKGRFTQGLVGHKDFIFDGMGSHWEVLRREVTQSDIHF